jgi:hypothetical protein
LAQAPEIVAAEISNNWAADLQRVTLLPIAPGINVQKSETVATKQSFFE